MKIQFLIIGFIASFQVSYSQLSQMWQWKDHFEYKNIKTIFQRPNQQYFCVSDQGIMIVNNDGSIEKLSKANGLNDTKITAAAYLESLDIIVVGYSNGNIDIIYPNRIVNINDYYRKNIPANKSINNIIAYQKYAYLSTGMGIIKIDLENSQIVETYIIGENSSYLEVIDLAIVRDTLFAISSKNLYKGALNSILIESSSWIKTTTTFTDFYDLGMFNENLMLIGKENNINKFVLYKPNGTIFPFASYIPPEAKCYASSQYIYLTSWNNFIKYRSNGYLEESISKLGDITIGKPLFIALTNKNEYLIGTEINGAIIQKDNNFSQYYINGVYKNYSKSVLAVKDRIIVVGGGFQGNTNLWYRGLLNVQKKYEWINKRQEGVYNYEAIAIDPTNSDHFFVGSGGSGLIEYNDTTLVKNYNWTNSPIETLIDNGHYSRVLGLTFDKNNNLWVFNSAKINPLNVLTPDKTWVSFNFKNEIPEKTTGGVVVTQKNIFVGVVKTSGLAFLDYNGTLDKKTDDISKIYYPTDPDGERIGTSVLCIAEDKEGVLWIGTDQGIGIIYKPEEFNEASFVTNKIKVTAQLNDTSETGYLLNTESILSIAIDGGNRKWIGTQNSGVYLISPSGTKQIENFTSKNSPLPSNTITSISIEPNTGEVYIATTMGLVSYRAEGTEAQDVFGDVYVFPNPVRPNYNGVITITNLAANVNVKITDIAGNLVYEANAIGGQATWNGKNFSGNRVATGVYLVLCTNDDGSATFVTKILFIN